MLQKSNPYEEKKVKINARMNKISTNMGFVSIMHLTMTQQQPEYELASELKDLHVPQIFCAPN